MFPAQQSQNGGFGAGTAQMATQCRVAATTGLEISQAQGAESGGVRAPYFLLRFVLDAITNPKSTAYSQRAFRQRKEQHLKELEDKVAVLEATRDRINAENARLQEDLERATEEYSLLQNLAKPSSLFDGADRSDGSCISAPSREWLASPPPTSSSEPHCLAASRPRYCGHELDAGQMWEFITGHRLFQEGLADVDSIARELRRFFPGDGMGGITEDILTHCIHESARLRQEGYRLQLTDKFRPSSI